MLTRFARQHPAWRRQDLGRCDTAVRPFAAGAGAGKSAYTGKMHRLSIFLLFACCAVAAGPDEDPASGRLLVATDEVRGPYFTETVILLLHYDEQGALGLVVNRPMAATPREALPDIEGMDRYPDTLYWGGPVQMATIRTLLRADQPPEDAEHIFDAVYLAHPDASLMQGTPSAANLRFFVGYAGWAPGQLEREIFYESWRVLPATEELVFAADTAAIWHSLMPQRQYRAALD